MQSKQLKEKYDILGLLKKKVHSKYVRKLHFLRHSTRESNN